MVKLIHLKYELNLHRIKVKFVSIYANKIVGGYNILFGRNCLETA